MNETIALKKLLINYNIIPNKKFAQNFLINKDIINKIIHSLGDVQNKNLLEIGPGIGCFTKRLLEMKLKSLTVIEIDRKFAPLLNKIKSRSYKNFQIIINDALKIKEESVINGRYIIVANLPYNISIPLILKWLKKLYFIDKIIIMLQKEVADQITAKPSNYSYGRLSVLVQFVCECELLFFIEPQNFFPSPIVKSSIIKLKPRKKLPSPKEINSFEKMCKLIFNFRRKTLKNSLGNFFNNPKEDLDIVEIKYGKRSEKLTINEVFRLSILYIFNKN